MAQHDPSERNDRRIGPTAYVTKPQSVRKVRLALAQVGIEIDGGRPTVG